MDKLKDYLKNINLISQTDDNDCKCIRCLLKNKSFADYMNNELIVDLFQSNVDEVDYIKDIIREIVLIIEKNTEYINNIDKVFLKNDFKFKDLKNIIEEAIRILHSKTIYFDTEINKITELENKIKNIINYEKNISDLNSRILLIEEKIINYNKIITDINKKINSHHKNYETQVNKIIKLEELINTINNKQTKFESLITSKITENDLKLQRYIDTNQYIFDNNELVFKRLNNQIEQLTIKLNLSEKTNTELAEQIDYSNNLFLLVETLRSDHITMIERLNTGEKVLQEIVNKLF